MTPTDSPAIQSSFLSAEEDAALKAQGFCFLAPLYVDPGMDRDAAGQDYYGYPPVYDHRGELVRTLVSYRFLVVLNASGIYLLTPPTFSGNRLEDPAALLNLAPHLVTLALTTGDPNP